MDRMHDPEGLRVAYLAHGLHLGLIGVLMSEQPETARLGIRRTELHKEADSRGEGVVFLTESGGIGMEFNGRIAVKRLEDWISMAWGDIPTVTRRR